LGYFFQRKLGPGAIEFAKRKINQARQNSSKFEKNIGPYWTKICSYLDCLIHFAADKLNGYRPYWYSLWLKYDKVRALLNAASKHHRHGGRMDILNTKRGLVESLILQFDAALKTLAHSAVAVRPSPAHSATPTLTSLEKRLSAQCMRVNHAGEVAAQGLYQGQALTARDPFVAEKMRQAALEEVDHLAWCETRLIELDSHTSYLALFWYTGSFIIGAIAGIFGDKWSLGFVTETEHQVMAHLNSHLRCLPVADSRSREIVAFMYEDEARHATQAISAGAALLPKPVSLLMRMMAKVMTTTARWI
jgi:ubiquinone biosynthesis monooxygenase Coq7